MSKQSSKQIVETSEKVFTTRFIVVLALVAIGIAWIVYYYAAVRIDPSAVITGKKVDAGSPAFMADLKNWNYLIGFGLIMLGLVLSAHKSTPLGRGRGIVVGMLGCFLVGLVWIVVYYMFSGEDLYKIWVMNDLANYNLLVGIGFMAVGFTFATKWE